MIDKSKFLIHHKDYYPYKNEWVVETFLPRPVSKYLYGVRMTRRRDMKNTVSDTGKTYEEALYKVLAKIGT
jgi:hypothetical protein